MVDYSRFDNIQASDSDEDPMEPVERIETPRVSGGIDYSKWDRIEVNDETETKPIITRLEKDQRVTIGPDGLSIHRSAPALQPSNTEAGSESVDNYSNRDLLLSKWIEESRQEELGETGMAFEDAYEWPRCGSAAQHVADLTSESQGESNTQFEQLIRNGGVSSGRYFWSQTAREIHVSVSLPQGVRAKQLAIQLSSENLEVASIISKEKQIIISGRFPHPVDPEEDSWLWEVVERKIDWELLQQISQQQQQEGASSGYFVEIHLKKKTPLPGVDVWWPCILVGEEEIDVLQLRDRRQKHVMTFRDAWEEAHSEFRDRVKNHTKKTLVIDSGDETCLELQRESFPG